MSGLQLYTAEVEKARIQCTGACTSFWDSVDASAKQSKSASADLNLGLGVVKRPEGTDQLTLNGLPLCRFMEEGAGQLEGDGFVDDSEGTHRGRGCSAGPTPITRNPRTWWPPPSRSSRVRAGQESNSRPSVP